MAAEELRMSAPESRPELLKPDEMAALLRISRSTLDRWSRRLGFPVIRQPHLVLFPWRRVLEYVERTAIEGGQFPSRADERKPKRGKKR
jgi:predicted DNA-binding transcriptional regulator AlpA